MTEWGSVYWSATILFWIAVAALGGLITFYCLRSGRRTGDRSMLLLGVGFGFISIATATIWFGSIFLEGDLYMASMGCTGMMAAGFAVIFAGLRVRAP